MDKSWIEVCIELSLSVCGIIILGSERTARYVFRVSMANRCQGGNGEVCVGRMNIRARRTRDFGVVVDASWARFGAKPRSVILKDHIDQRGYTQ